jgi:hypothetical protein
MRHEFSKTTQDAERAVSDTVKAADASIKSAQTAAETPALAAPPVKPELPAPDATATATAGPVALPKPGT